MHNEPSNTDPWTAADAALAAHVDAAGWVDYRALQHDPALPAAVAAYADGRWPQPPGGLAYWLNAYNLFTLDLIVRHYPLDSIAQLHRLRPMPLAVALKQSAWDRFRFGTAEGLKTLNEIEGDIVRKRFAEPRIHAALVCAARSCPPLRRELYREADLEAQLDDQMRRWLGDPSKNRYETATNTLRLSAIFLIYGGDFRAAGRSVRAWARAYLPDDARAAIDRAGRPPKVRYLKYDWALNEQAGPGGA